MASSPRGSSEMDRQMKLNDLPRYQADVAGRDLREVVAEVAPDKIADPQLIVLLNGLDVSDRMEGIKLLRDDRVVIGLLPAGHGKSKSVGQIVVGIILVVASFYTAGTSWAAYSSAMMAMGAGQILSGVSGLLIKPPSLNASQNSNPSVGSTAFLGGVSNQAKPYGVIPKIYGRHRVFPNLAANPLVDNVGTVSEISAIYDFGYGNVEVDTNEVRIGESLASTFLPEYKLWQNTKDIVPILATSSVHYDQLSFVPQQNVAATFTTKAGSLQAVIDLGFTAGLFFISQYGSQNETLVEVVVEWAPTGTGNWTKITTDNVRGIPAYPGNWRPAWPMSNWNQIPIKSLTGEGIILYGKLTQPGVASITIPFPQAGQYDIRIRRTTPVWTGSDTIKIPGTVSGEDSFTPVNSFTITMIKSRLGGAMFNLRKPHTMLEMRLTASEKLSGVVQNMSCVVTSILKTYDAQGNVTGEIPTRNPAWIGLDILLGDANPRPLRPEQIDWPAWVYLAQRCDEQRTWSMLQEDGSVVEKTDSRFYCDMVLDAKGTVGEVLDSVLSVCRAMRLITNSGLYSVALDEEQTIPRQLITPDNSWDFQGSRIFSDKIHGLRVKFTASEHDWQQMEVLVFADGYASVGSADGSVKGAENIETVESLGITDSHHAWAYGRYMLAQAILRSEMFSVTMDIEHLVLQRGNLVYVSHSTPRVGGTATRIKSISGNTIYVAAPPESQPSGYTVRQAIDGTVRQGRVTGVTGDGGITLDDAGNLRPDDLIVLGTFTSVIKPYIVQTITPGDSMSAVIQLAPYDESLYRADIHQMPVWNPGFSNESGGISNLVVHDLTNTQSTLPSGTVVRNELSWQVSGYGYTSADILFIQNGMRTPIATVVAGATSYTWDVDLSTSAGLVGPGKIMVIPNSISGGSGVPQTIDVVLAQDTTPPGEPTDVTLTGTTLTWTPPTDSDLHHFEIASLPADATVIDWEHSTRVDGVTADKHTYTVADGSLIYLVRAVDTSGNEGHPSSTHGTVVQVLVLQDLAATSSVVIVDRKPVQRTVFTWTITGTGYRGVTIHAAPANSDLITLSGGELTWTWDVSLIDHPNFAGTNTITVTPSATNGFVGTGASTDVSLTADTTAPAAPTALAVSTGTLSWTAPADADLDHFEVRSQPNTETPAWGSATALGTTAWNVTQIAISDATRTYLVRAVDTSGNAGAVAILQGTGGGTGTTSAGWSDSWGDDWGGTAP